jgi:hypothetical protein
MGALELIRKGWGFRLPGERSLYWNPGHRLLDGCMEVFTTSQGKITWYCFFGVPDEVINEARRIREAQRRMLEDLRYEWEK